MNVFSRPIKEQQPPVLSWRDYYKNNVILSKYKIPELKAIARSHDLYVSGTKPVLIKRISSHFHLIKNIVLIQTYFRRHLVYTFFNLLGKRDKDEKYINDTDFYTMDPLNEIPFYDFLKYKDKNGFLYGFHFYSLMKLLKNNNELINPYTRERMDLKLINTVCTLSRLNYILFKHTYDEFDVINHDIESNCITRRNDVIRNLEEIRTRPIISRIEQAFMEIDFLGNYTQSSWFTSLGQLGYMRFLQDLVDIWNYRSNMSFTVMIQITPYYNPFSFGFTDDIYSYQRRTITIIENIIFSGGDVEYRKLGAIHILTALTMVSQEARYAMPWLYESVVF